MLRLRVAVAFARIARTLSRLFRRGGTALPGLVALRIDPRIIEKLAGTLKQGVVVVTGTNGKTTTAKMITTMLRGADRAVLANREGSNLARGVAATLIDASHRGRLEADIGIFEIDEAAVRDLAKQLRPRLIVVTNLARDQLDRYGELETTAGHVGSAVGESEEAVLNTDDPMVASLAGSETLWFGAVPEIRETMPHDHALYGAQQQPPRNRADAVVEATGPASDGQRAVIRVGGEEVDVLLQVPGAYNAYNAAAALLAVQSLGLDPVDAAADLAAMPPAFGRGQVIDYRGRRVKLLLVKNPASLNQAIRILADEPKGHRVLVAINDNHADGRDVSWLWDASVEHLAETPHIFGAGGVRAADMALRFKYAGVESWAESDDSRALDRLVEGAAEGEVVYLIPTYTAMLSFLALLLPGVKPEEAWS